MRRILTHAAMCILIGALLNVLIAWSCVALQHELKLPAWSHGHSLDEVKLIWTDEMIAKQTRIKHLDTKRHAGMSRHIAIRGAMVSSSGESVTQSGMSITLRAGFPFDAFSTRELQLTEQRGETPHDPVNETRILSIRTSWLDEPLVLAHHPVDLGPITLRVFELPKRPLPRGFAANTMIYAMPFLVPALFRSIRGYRRQKHGWCVRCGYDVCTQDTCPECGKARVDTSRHVHHDP